MQYPPVAPFGSGPNRTVAFARRQASPLPSPRAAMADARLLGELQRAPRHQSSHVRTARVVAALAAVGTPLRRALLLGGNDGL